MVKSHMEAYMNKDSSVAEKLFAENLELYDQFSNNQKDNKTVVNPGGRQGLIEGDKFAHILFSDVKVTTDKIQTYNLISKSSFNLDLCFLMTHFTGTLNFNQ